MIGAVLVGLTLLCAAGRRAPAAADVEMLPYDPGSVETVRGRVVRIVRIVHPTGTGVHLMLRTEAGDDLPVALGPIRFVERAFPIRVGDEIEITGARVVRGKPAFMASEVKKDDQIPRLRDRYGVPVWEHGGERRSIGTAR